MAMKKNQRGYKLKKKAINRFMLGATLIEMICLIALALCVLIGYLLVHNIIESWYGCLLGVVLGVIAFLIFGTVGAILAHLWSGSGLPMCHNGCCRGPGHFRAHGDYDIQKFGEEYYNICKCGNRYQRRGKRFVFINEDGTATPYLIWRRFRGWCPDEDALVKNTSEHQIE